MKKYINRETSWLRFNERVNEMSFDPDVPILERLNFISIATSNLDEFFSVRVAGLIEQAKLDPNKKSYDGLTANEQLIQVDHFTRKLISKQNQSFEKIEQEVRITILEKKNFI